MAEVSGNTKPSISLAGTDDWRALLNKHAQAVYLSGEAGRGSASPGRDQLQAQLAALLGPMAEEAIQIVEAFAIGARAQAGALAVHTVPPELETRLAIILSGFAPEPAPAAAEEGGSPHIIQSELWQLLYKVRESAELSYAREADLVELDRRILLLLRHAGPQVPASISAAVGVDKAQVSRSVKRLLEIKVVERDQIRSPITLTRKGTGLADKLLRLAEMRNRELTFDIDDGELGEFSGVIERLLQRAVLLYEQERARGAGDAKSANPYGADVDVDGDDGRMILIDRTRIISPLMSLSAYFSRSGSLTFKRMTGLSNFETWVLNEIGRDAPLEWNLLVARLDRDHSQAGRTVAALMERGLVERQGRPGRRHGRFAPTSEGKRLFEIIQEASRQRSVFLMAPLNQKERARFLATFDKIHRNAAVQLERERTIAELGQQ